MRKFLLPFLVSLLALAGCNKQEPPVFSGFEAGTMAGGVFTSDSGTKMYVTENGQNFDISRSRRVILQYETLSVSDPDRIEISIQGLMDAFIRDPYAVDALSDQPEGSPIEVTDAWFSGGFLNLLVSAEGKDYGKHRCSATYLVDKDKIVIRLLHHDSEDVTDSMINAFLSIPMEEPALSYDQYAQSIGKKDGLYPAPVLFQWTARTLEGGPLNLYEREGSYMPPSAK
jgi:hypothetical protein